MLSNLATEYRRLAPVGYVLWALWGLFVSIIGTSTIAYVLAQVSDHLYTSLAIIFYCFVVIVLWLTLTFHALRDDAYNRRLEAVENREVPDAETIKENNDLLRENIEALHLHGI
jgi:hypothetical protein